MSPTLNLPAEAATTASSLLPAGLQPRTLALPSVDQPWRYGWACGGAALRGLCSPHRLRPAQDRSYSAAVRISPRLANRWRGVFDVPSQAAAVVPLQTHQSVGTLLHSQLFADLGLNSRHRLHLQHRTVHHAPVAACAKERDRRLTCHVPRVLRLGPDKALVEVHTEVATALGQPLTHAEDGFLIHGLASADLAGLQTDRALMRELLGLRRRLPLLSVRDDTVRVGEMAVPRQMGMAYGRISGALSPLHISRVGAWLFGQQRPVLHGLALRNLVVRHLAELRVPMQELSLNFTAAACLGQMLWLLVDGEAFEVQDPSGRLLAFGSSRAAD